MRLDQYLVNKGHEPSREKAKKSILAELVKVNDKIETKPSTKVSDEDRIVVVDTALQRVSADGEKLEKILLRSDFDLDGKLGMDIGSAIGGFTEVLLEHKIEKVISIDLVKDLLHPKISANSRVTSLENQDFRELTVTDLPFQPNVVVCDVSFVSLTEIIRTCRTMLRGEYHFFGLIKPQHEMTEKFRIKDGIVKTDKWRIQAINKITLTAKELGFQQHGEVTAIAGDGVNSNLEYGIHLSIGETLN